MDRDAKAAMETVKRTVHTLLSNSYDLGKLIVTKVGSGIATFRHLACLSLLPCGQALWRGVESSQYAARQAICHALHELPH